GQQAAGHQVVFQGIPIVLPRLHAPEEANDVEQDDQIQDANQQQEDARDAGANQAAQVFQLAVPIDEVGHDELGGHAQGEGDQEDDRRVAKSKENSDVERLLAFLQQLARGVVDGREMV